MQRIWAVYIIGIMSSLLKLDSNLLPMVEKYSLNSSGLKSYKVLFSDLEGKIVFNFFHIPLELRLLLIIMLL